MNTVNKTTLALLDNLIKTKALITQKEEETIKTSKTASSLGFLYEKARNAIEFRDEHLVRRAAIERILKRRLILNQNSEKIAKLLIKELSWAKYFKDQDVQMSKIESVTKTIKKYKNIISTNKSDLNNIIIGLCSCEIEEKLVFNPLSQILINYVSASIFPRINFEENDNNMKHAQIYIATERAFAKNDEILIMHKLIKSISPNWENPEDLIPTIKKTNNYLNYPLKDILKRKVSQIIPPFNLIKEIILNEDEFLNIVQDKSNLEKLATEILEKKYTEVKDKVMRASKRSIIYIFLTKMILAILIELPFEIFFGELNYFVLLINIIFPPSLMYLFNLGVKLPDNKNTKSMIKKLSEYLYKNENEITPDFIDLVPTTSTKNKAFFYLFLITSLIIIISILWFLKTLGFSPISQIIFFFFLTVVSFFAFRVREISKDFQLTDEYNETFWESIIDYIFLPIIKVGQFLSNQISKLNFLSFIFDFIIEAPLKSFLEILEDWLHFVRIKKEEILS